MTGESTYPDHYWHVTVTVNRTGVGERTAILNDLSFDELSTKFINPWRKGVSFTIDGVPLSSKAEIVHIQIVRTERSQKYYEDYWNNQNRNSSVVIFGHDTRTLVFGSDETDYTNDLLYDQLSDETLIRADLGLLKTICSRIRFSASALEDRRKGGTSYVVRDEYDVQDLLYAVIRASVKFAIQEQPIEKLANAASGRADLAINELGSLIEVKYARKAADQKKFAEEISHDLQLYSKWPHLEHLIVLIYNSQALKDPEAFDKDFSGPQKIGGKEFVVHVILS